MGGIRDELNQQLVRFTVFAQLRNNEEIGRAAVHGDKR